MVTFYYATEGTGWTRNSNWLSEKPVSEWYGVTTSPSGRLVLRLELSNNGLFGEIPLELGDLSGLQNLDLSENSLQSEIPSELGNLTDLDSLNLHTNRLRGEIPSELANLTYLRVLNLHTNQLAGEIPPELGDLTFLETLDLSNNFLEGHLPPELGNLGNLKTLELDGNTQLDGCLPEGSGVPYCTSPTNVRYVHEPGLGGRYGTATISWVPVWGATYYVLFHDDTPRTGSCPGGCEAVASEIFGTTYVFELWGSWGYPHFWVAACTDHGCSQPSEKAENR